MCERIVHRGPDSRGVHASDGVALGIQRLAVIDLKTRRSATSLCSVPPDDAEAASAAVLELAGDPDLRKRLVAHAHSYVSGRTLEAESARVARFLAGG